MRGTVVEMTEAGAIEHLDRLCELYVGRSPYYYGYVYPAEQQQRETRIICRSDAQDKIDTVGRWRQSIGDAEAAVLLARYQRRSPACQSRHGNPQ